jgi:hypothetical protein
MKPVSFSDIQTQRSTHIEPSSYVNVYAFAPADIKVINVPADASVVAFSSTGNFFVNFNGYIASGGGKTDGTGDELNPTTRYVDKISTFSVYAPAALTLSVAFYGVQ